MSNEVSQFTDQELTAESKAQNFPRLTEGYGDSTFFKKCKCDISGTKSDIRKFVQPLKENVQISPGQSAEERRVNPP